jgi:hypothetical protein
VPQLISAGPSPEPSRRYAAHADAFTGLRLAAIIVSWSSQRMRTWRRLVVLVVIVATGALFYRWWQAASSRAQRANPPSAASDER